MADGDFYVTFADLRALLAYQQSALSDAVVAVMAMPRVTEIALGQGRVLALLAVGASADIEVPLTRQMSGTDYRVEIPGQAGMLFAVKSRQLGSVTLTVTAQAVIAAGTLFLVGAWQ